MLCIILPLRELASVPREGPRNQKKKCMEMPAFNICYSNVQCAHAHLGDTQGCKAATFSFTSGHSGPNIQAQSFHATLESSSMVRTVQPNHKSSMLTRRCAVTFFQLWWNQKQKAKWMLDASMSLWRHSVAWNAWFLIQICEQPYESWVSSHHHFMI